MTVPEAETEFWKLLGPWAEQHHPAGHAYVASAIGRGDMKDARKGFRRLVEIVIERGELAALDPLVTSGALDVLRLEVAAPTTFAGRTTTILGRDVGWRAWDAIKRGRLNETDVATILRALKLYGGVLVDITDNTEEPDGEGPRTETARQDPPLSPRAEIERRSAVVRKVERPSKKRNPGPSGDSQLAFVGLGIEGPGRVAD